MPDHAVYHQQQGGGGGDGLEKSWSPLQKITQEEASESLGGVWSRVELDGSRGGVGGEGRGGGSLLCTASSSCLGRDRRQRGPRVWLERERGAKEWAREEKEKKKKNVLTPHGMEGRRWCGTSSGPLTRRDASALPGFR